MATETVSIHLLLTQPDGSPAVGIVEFRPTRWRVTGSTVVEPARPITVTLDDTGQAVVDLAVTGWSWAWEAVERVPGGRTRYLLVDIDDSEYANLFEVDKKSLKPCKPEWSILERLSDQIHALQDLVNSGGGGGGSNITIVDNGDGTFTITDSGKHSPGSFQLIDNGDGTYTITNGG